MAVTLGLSAMTSGEFTQEMSVRAEVAEIINKHETVRSNLSELAIISYR